VKEEYGIALDLATERTGVFCARGDHLLGAQVLKVPPGDGEKWVRMAEMVITYLSCSTPDYVCIEDTHYQSNASVLKVLSRLAGAVMFWCYTNHIACYIATPAEIDSACNIEHKGRKKQIRDFAKRLGFALPQDSADALALMFWGIGTRRRDVLVREADDGRYIVRDARQ
jgi:Holliday junction resolvasome RuvABC endonuclease subunit